MGTKRQLKKISDKQYMLIMDDDENRLHTEKGYAKHELTEAYAGVRSQMLQLEQAIAQGKKHLEKNKVNLTKEEEKMLAVIEKATKKVEYDKQKEILDKQLVDYNSYKEQMKELETAIPELLRKK